MISSAILFTQTPEADMTILCKTRRARTESKMLLTIWFYCVFLFSFIPYLRTSNNCAYLDDSLTWGQLYHPIQYLGGITMRRIVAPRGRGWSRDILLPWGWFVDGPAQRRSTASLLLLPWARTARTYCTGIRHGCTAVRPLPTTLYKLELLFGWGVLKALDGGPLAWLSRLMSPPTLLHPT